MLCFILCLQNKVSIICFASLDDEVDPNFVLFYTIYFYHNVNKIRLNKMKLSHAEQIKLTKALPKSILEKMAVDLSGKLGGGDNMRGSGFFEDMGKWLVQNVGPVFKEVGPIILNDILLPILRKKIEQKLGGGLGLAGSTSSSGKGLKLAGKGNCGNGLKLAGKGKMMKGSQEMKEHMAKLRAMRKK